MMRILQITLAASLATLLAACGEKPQTAEGRRSDAKAWQGADTVYTASGWKAGDKASWEEQLRKRAQTQNEYARVR
jgi:outer membrane biogenesis lipoprotein LolB